MADSDTVVKKSKGNWRWKMKDAKLENGAVSLRLEIFLFALSVGVNLVACYALYRGGRLVLEQVRGLLTNPPVLLEGPTAYVVLAALLSLGLLAIARMVGERCLRK